MNTTLLYLLVATLLIISTAKDRKKTRQALKKAWKAFNNILPEFLGIILFVGILMAFLDPVTVSRLLGRASGWVGVIVAAVVGAVTLIPGFIAFPTAAILLENGAGFMQIGAFVSALMMVGVVTYPVERKYFGAKLTILRNSLAFVFSLVVAFVIGKIVGGY